MNDRIPWGIQKLGLRQLKREINGHLRQGREYYVKTVSNESLHKYVEIHQWVPYRCEIIPDGPYCTKIKFFIQEGRIDE